MNFHIFKRKRRKVVKVILINEYIKTYYPEIR